MRFGHQQIKIYLVLFSIFKNSIAFHFINTVQKYKITIIYKIHIVSDQ